MPTRMTGTELGENFSEGARLLWCALEKQGLNVEAGRRMLGFATGCLNRYLYGVTRPGILAIKSINDVFQIPALAFADPPKKKFMPPALRHALAVSAKARARKAA